MPLWRKSGRFSSRRLQIVSVGTSPYSASRNRIVATIVRSASTLEPVVLI